MAHRVRSNVLCHAVHDESAIWELGSLRATVSDRILSYAPQHSIQKAVVCSRPADSRKDVGFSESKELVGLKPMEDKSNLGVAQPTCSVKLSTRASLDEVQRVLERNRAEIAMRCNALWASILWAPHIPSNHS